jgi:cell wall-associated NlpC family hydrolase
MNKPSQDQRSAIVLAAKWGAANKSHFVYTEGAHRMDFEKQGIKFPITTDCSGFVTFCYRMAGCADPNNMSYNGSGYTGTLLAHGQVIPLKDVLPGDVIVYGPGTGWHTAIVVDVTGPNATNPLTISHGQQGDPSYVHVNQDGRTPQRYLRFPTAMVRPPIPLG